MSEGENRDLAASTEQEVTRANPTPGVVQWTMSPPLTRLVAYGRKVQEASQVKFGETYPRILDASKHCLKLCALASAIIFVVMIASFIMAIQHWCTVVVGHFVLRHIVPESIDDNFAQMRIDYTMAFAAIGAFLVNLPPFVIFLLSFPLTFDRTVLEGSAAPANEFVKRVTPKNRFALLLLKYAPRLSAGPVGCKVYWLFEAAYQSPIRTLDVPHAFAAGVAGELVLSGLGYLKNTLKKRRVVDDSVIIDTLPK